MTVCLLYVILSKDAVVSLSYSVIHRLDSLKNNSKSEELVGINFAMCFVLLLNGNSSKG